MNTKNITLINACANADCLILGTDAVRNRRGSWGEMIQITLSRGVVLGMVDENGNGWIRLMKADGDGYKIVSQTDINKENVNEVMKNITEQAK